MTVGTATRPQLPVTVERVRLVNYRSIERCDVRLGPLTYLVGPNGAGKSNFADALRLVSESLTTSLEQAVRERAGFYEIRRRGAREGTSIELDLNLPGESAVYGFQLERAGESDFRVRREWCEVRSGGSGSGAGYQVEEGDLTSSETRLPLPSSNRLYLVTAASLPVFRPVFEALRRMAFYSISPTAIRRAQPPDSGELLARDGWNAASVVERLSRSAPAAWTAVEEYLSAVVPGVVHVRDRSLLSQRLLQFEQESSAGAGQNPRFMAQAMSDGTLSAFGVLLALFQRTSGDPSELTLVGIEEPETAIHPAAVAVLREALAEASTTKQVLVTTHSPELLDHAGLEPDSLLAVESRSGTTIISRPDAVGVRAIREGLFTAGELLRVGQLFAVPPGQDSASDPDSL